MEAMAAAAAHEEDSVVDTDVWLACAVPLSRLPAVGSQVYYFPHGHAEQCPAPLPAPLPTPHLFPCTVTAVRLAADPETNEVLAEISLQPGPHRDRGSAADDANATATAMVYYAKQLTQSDANNGGGFSVPRYCADVIFPKLDFEADPPVQNLLMRDTVGNHWQFRHIYRGTPRRHLLTTGWSKFVNAKLLVAGDTVVFMRRPDGELLIGLRRAPRYPVRQATPRSNARARVPPEKVMEAARLAAEGSPFTVTYYPRHGAGEFVVPRKEVEDALAFTWEPGMQVRTQVMEAEDARRTEWATGTLKELHANMWRALEVEWDDSASTSSTNKGRFLNGWQLQFVGYPPLLKRLRIPDTTHLCSRETAPPTIAPQSQDDIPAAAALGMQEARHNNGPTTASAMITTHLLFPSPVEDQSGAGSSEILDPVELGSPPTNSRPAVEEPKKSIQLFGATITPHAAEDGCSEEVNNQQITDA